MIDTQTLEILKDNELRRAEILFSLAILEKLSYLKYNIIHSNIIQNAKEIPDTTTKRKYTRAANKSK